MATRSHKHSRRDVVKRAGVTAGAVLALGPNTWAEEAREKTEEETPVSPPEDLMREHAVLSRLLLVYEKATPTAPGSAPPATKELAEASKLIRAVVEDYHERLEEQYVFPVFEKAGKLTDLTQVLRMQHHAGRRLTDIILQMTEGPIDAPTTEKLIRCVGQFIRMYRPHAARESTVLFPQLHTLLPEREFDRMGDLFEEIEHQRFGPEGFEGVVAKVADLEKRLGIHDLAQFTPQVT
jgi:hemerythrin-like domain-containing protein